MTTITIAILKTGQIVDREFEDVSEARKFLLKCRYSKKVRKLAVSTETQGEYEYLYRYF